MDNNTDFNLDDHVRIYGGFEDGIVGLVCDVDLSGARPRFRVKSMGGGGDTIGGLTAARLVGLDGEWKDDTGYWSDGIKSWVGSIMTPDTTLECVLRIREEAPGETYTWTAHNEDGSLIDRGIAPSLIWAKRHAINATIWHHANVDL